MASILKSLPDWVAIIVFSLYSLGLLVMFVWTVVSVAKGRIKVFTAVSSSKSVKHPAPAEEEDGSVSLSRLQMFLWTLVMIFAWLFQLVKHPGEFPELPNQALLLMGISGAAYLGAKQQRLSAERDMERAKRTGDGK